MKIRSPSASDVGARLLQALFAPLAVLSIFVGITIGAPSGMIPIWSAVGDLGVDAISDSSWVLPAMLALTAALYALVIGDGLVGTDVRSEGRIRRAAGAVALCIASTTICWIVVSVIGGIAHPSTLPHLLGVLILGLLTLAVALLFGSFQFYSGRERLSRASKGFAKLHRRRTAIPGNLVTTIPSWIPAIATAVSATALGAVGLVIFAGYPASFAVIVAWLVPAVLTPFLWWQSIEFRLDSPNRPWSAMSLIFGLYVVVAFGYLVVITGFPVATKGALLAQVLLIAISASPVRLPSWMRPWSLNSGGATRAANVLDQRLSRSRVSVAESIVDIPLADPEAA
jgi:hypothetical protein